MKFQPITKIEGKREVFSLHLDAELSQRLAKAVERLNISKQELVRQMIDHCLKNMEKKK